MQTGNNVTVLTGCRIYHEMDTNHSGVITFDEFLIGALKHHWDFNSLTPKIEKKLETE